MTSSIQVVITVMITIIFTSMCTSILEGICIYKLIEKLEEKNKAIINLLSTREEQRRIENSHEEMRKKYLSLAARQAEEMARHNHG